MHKIYEEIVSDVLSKYRMILGNTTTYDNRISALVQMEKELKSLDNTLKTINSIKSTGVI